MQQRSEILDAIWKDDVLDRRKDAEFIRDFVLGRIAERRSINLPASYVLNIDAPWGEGKTFFLERFAKTLEVDRRIVAHVNAWKDDHAADPLVSVVAAVNQATGIDSKLKRTLKKVVTEINVAGGQIAVAAGRGFLTQSIKRLIGEEAADDIAGYIQGATKSASKEAVTKLDRTLDERAKKLIEDHIHTQETARQFRDALAKYVSTLDDRAPLFVLVDELDRCRPLYAIALLERIKHLFDVDGIAFVVATDTQQLRHAVCAVYGAEFNSVRYLSRFFDTTYVLERASSSNFINFMLATKPISLEKVSFPPQTHFEAYFTQAMDSFDLTLRDAQRIYEIILNVVTAWRERVEIEMCVLVPLAIGYYWQMDIAVNTIFFEALRSKAKRQSKWIVSFAQRRERGDGSRVGALEMFGRFVELAETPLDEYRDEPQKQDGQWVAHRRRFEYSKIHNNARYAGSPRPYSLIRDYPRLIRNAGRFNSPEQ